MTAVLCNYCPPAPTTRSARCPHVATHGRRCCLSFCRVRRHRTGRTILNTQDYCNNSLQYTTLTCPTNDEKKLRRRQPDTTVAGSPLNKIFLFFADCLPAWSTFCSPRLIARFQRVYSYHQPRCIDDTVQPQHLAGTITRTCCEATNEKH